MRHNLRPLNLASDGLRDGDFVGLEDPNVRTAFQLLLQAYQCARDVGRSPWDFALELQVLSQAGVGHTHLRWLMCRGYIEHGRETSDASTRKQHTRRVMRVIRGLHIQPSSCFILTSSGVQLACKKLHAAHDASIPRWSPSSWKLHLGKQLVKAFRRPAMNQTAVLDAFEQQGWPERIDNPLVTDIDGEASVRLHDAIKRLNHQEQKLIHFRGDGSGQGVTWELSWTETAPRITPPLQSKAGRRRATSL